MEFDAVTTDMRTLIGAIVHARDVVVDVMIGIADTVHLDRAVIATVSMTSKQKDALLQMTLGPCCLCHNTLVIF